MKTGYAAAMLASIQMGAYDIYGINLAVHFEARFDVPMLKGCLPALHGKWRRPHALADPLGERMAFTTHMLVELLLA